MLPPEGGNHTVQPNVVIWGEHDGKCEGEGGQHSLIAIAQDYRESSKSLLVQAQTRYSYEYVTNWKDCIMENNDTFYNCSYAKETIEEFNLTCGNATRERRVTVGTRDGMNILGIIIFSIAFSVVLARLGSEGAKVVRVIATLNEAIMKLVGFVMW